MKLRKFLTLFLFIISSLFLFGCQDFFPAKADPEIQAVQTKQEAFDFIINKARTWNVLKAKVSMSIVQLPLEGHVDITNKKLYIERYTTNEAKEKVVSQYVYLQDLILYSCEYVDNAPVYSITSIKEEFDIDMDINEILKAIDNPVYNLDDMTYEKTDSTITFTYNLKYNTSNYETKLIYKNKTIQVVVEGIATITFSQDDPNYFTNLNLDLTPFENLA